MSVRARVARGTERRHARAVRAASWLGIVGLTTFAVSCSVPEAALPEQPAAARGVEHAHLLLHPVEDAAALLGRPVRMTSDGAWTIGPERAPTCEVAVRRERARFATERRVEVTSLTTLSVGYQALVGIAGKFGKATHAQIAVRNSELLRADVRGDCGEAYVDTVYIGQGRRSLLAAQEMGARAAGVVSAVSPELGVSSEARVVDETAWTEDHAYGFTVRVADASSHLGLAIRIPGEITEGAAVTVQIDATAEAFLVVYFVEESGEAAVLWPSDEERTPRAGPGQPAVLPSAQERAAGISLRAALREDGRSARETLVVYAFAERADFERWRPRGTGRSVDGAAYAAELSTRLEAELPLSRWARAMTSYVVLPREGRPPSSSE
jgi:hypothetical protein